MTALHTKNTVTNNSRHVARTKMRDMPHADKFQA